MSKKWEDIPREDLNMIPQMEKSGWIVFFSNSDRTYKRVTPDKVPYDPVDYTKDNKHCWECWHGWAVAELIDDHFKNHRYYKTLKGVLENE